MTDKNTTLCLEDQQGALIDAEGFIAGIVQQALQAFLEAEMADHLCAGRYERTEERQGVRNGYKPRSLRLRAGSIDLEVPQCRDGSFHTELFARYQKSERAFTLAIVEMWLNGVSTRKVAKVAEALCGTGISKSSVSVLCANLDAEVEAWRSRDLAGHTYPYVFVDTVYENVRRGGRVLGTGMLVALGIRDDGRREVLDVAIADTESASAYQDLFCSLRERGVAGVMLVVSDAHAGLRAAIRRYFQGASWQRCQVHFARDAQGKVSPARRGELGADIAAVFGEADKAAAMARAAEAADKWRAAAPRVAAMLDEDVESCLSALDFPAEHQVGIRTNNMLERLNEEIRRRDRVIGIFPNEGSAMRLVASLCIERSEAWVTGAPYLDMSLLDVDDQPSAAVLRYRVVTRQAAAV